MIRKFTYIMLISGLISGNFLAPALADERQSSPSQENSATSIDWPSETEIKEMVDDLPNFNAIIDDFITLAQDETVQKRMETMGETLSRRLEASDAFNMDEAGKVDINQALEVMLLTLTDKNIQSGLTDTLNDLQDILETHGLEQPQSSPTLSHKQTD